MKLPAKKNLLYIGAAFYSLALCALPAVKDFLPTESGQYVYYRDRTYNTCVYIGFLQYDESTYAIRYYSPNARTGSRELNIFIRLEADKDYVSMSGEKILETLKAGDAETLNYLHDLFYEFAALRKKLNSQRFTNSASHMKTLEQTEDFSLWGEEFVFVYDCIVPIFNLREIKNKAGKKTFTAITIGQLACSSDTAFSSFTGLPQQAEDVKAIDINAVLSPPAGGAQFTAKTETMDSLLRQIADNFWFWESEALMYTDVLQISENSFGDSPYIPLHTFARKLSCAGSETILCFEKQILSLTDSRLFLANCIYDKMSQRFVYHIEIIAKKDKPLFEIRGFKIFADYYDKHKVYFNQKIREAMEF